jgi:hypothetical protein
MMRMFSYLKGKWSEFRHYWKVRKYIPKTIDIKKATDKDLNALGRTTYFHKETEGGAVLVKSSMQAIRHKKTRRVVMFMGTIDQIKDRFGDDYEIVESEIKEPQDEELFI